MSIKGILSAAAAMLVFVSSAFADNAATMAKIESANASVKTVEAHFAQKRLLRASGKVTKSEGTFDYIAPDKLSMKHDAPSKDRFIINGNKCYINRGGVVTNFDTAKNAMAATLSNTLLYCVQGKIQKAADDNNANIAIAEANGNYVVTLTAKAQSSRGYSKIVLTYRKSDCLCILMETEEVGGINTTYTLTSLKTGANVDASVFEIPKK